jgi:hypothetical protein
MTADEPCFTTHGTLKWARFSLQKPMIFASLAAVPGFRAINAQGVSPHFSSDLATNGRLEHRRIPIEGVFNFNR